MDRESIVSHGLLELADEVARFHRVRLEDLFTGQQRGRIGEARAHLVYEVKDFAGTYSGAGRILGLEHTTVMHACKRWAAVVGDVGLLAPRKRRAA